MPRPDHPVLRDLHDHRELRELQHGEVQEKHGDEEVHDELGERAAVALAGGEQVLEHVEVGTKAEGFCCDHDDAEAAAVEVHRRSSERIELEHDRGRVGQLWQPGSASRPPLGCTEIEAELAELAWLLPVGQKASVQQVVSQNSSPIH